MPRYCDIVMKGGITSGVVYPLAAVRLAEEYRFRNVGGTSAGAIAAAAVAAAEYGKRTRHGRGYDGIQELPEWLGGNLTSLFQPSRRMRPLLDAMISATTGGTMVKALAAPNSVPLAAVLGMVPGIALIVASALLESETTLRVFGIIGGALLVLAGILAGTAISYLWRLRALPRHYFGICSGNDRDGQAADPPLTRWLADLLDDLAGKDKDVPLTFGDLWRLEEPDGERGVNLEMITTCLTHGRPYKLPFEANEFWFRPNEFRDLFPERIVRWMEVHAEPPEIEIDDPGLRRLPRAADLPIVVAARMSLSFPLLIAAVPLYAINYERQPVRENQPERCWFSDGGITSNFPIHFFDSPLPRWPTFAINLLSLPEGRSLDEDEGNNIWMPDDNSAGREERWDCWGKEKPLMQGIRFGSSIFHTAQNWLDSRQMGVHGYRDRIVHVYLDENEGGTNLKMDREVIERISERGAEAASLLRHRFAVPAPPETVLGWENQRWIRYRTFMQLLEGAGTRLRTSYLDESVEGRTMTELNQRPVRQHPPGYPWGTQSQRARANQATEALLALFPESEAGKASFAHDAPSPSPELRVMPRF